MDLARSRKACGLFLSIGIITVFMQNAPDVKKIHLSRGEETEARIARSRAFCLVV
jgi:hypothetical protein